MRKPEAPHRAILITLPWPRKELWQNRRPHWHAAREAARKARKDAYNAFFEAGGRNLLHIEGGTYALHFSFYQPNLTKRDLQNMPATQKSAIDGIADALGVDDSTFQVHWPTEWGPCDRPHGSVTVELRPLSIQARTAERAG